MATGTETSERDPASALAAEMPKAWKPQEVEQAMYAAWEEAGLFTADAADDGPRFVMSMPPPNITGELHLGHAQYTVQDLYCRYHRMLGENVLWVPGTDHAALGTNALIEKQLLAEGTSREAIGRTAFDQRVSEWYANYGPVILNQLRRLGFTADWTRLRFTMDPAYVRSVRTAFVRLYEDGLIYRAPRIVNWCPRCGSSVSDLEIKWREREDVLYYIRYDMADGEGSLTVATVRPETMLADTAVAVNPNDERYKKFIGRYARLPIVGRELRVVADDYVDPKFGTGALKVTPGHDPNDYEIGRRHELEILSCIDKDGNIVSDDWVPDELRSRDAETVRGRVVEMLRDRDHLVRTEAYVHEVAHCERSGNVIEPLVDDQWWCAMADLARPAIEVVEDGRVRFEPPRYGVTYLEWMRQLRDWNISRQIWLGHRVPVYHCAADSPHVFASVEEPSTCPHCGSSDLAQDPDVLDTWFSSALWPFATLGWPDDTADLRAFYPTTMLDTGREIIPLWVSRMIMTGLRFTGQPPFTTVFIHAVIQAADGDRMSKSKGNGVDPLVMVERYGADAVRAWSAEVAVPRQDVRFDEDRIRAYQLYANKLWNVARYVLGATEATALAPVGDIPPDSLLAVDRWILSRLDGLVERVSAGLDAYRPGEGMTSIYDFTWHDLADWYIEVIKPRLQLDPVDPARVAAASVVTHVLDQVVRLLHPFMPFVTEAVWQRLPGVDRRPLTARADPSSWPVTAGRRAPSLENAVESLFDLVRRLRDARKEMGAGERDRLDAVLRGGFGDEIPSSEVRQVLALLARLDLVDSLGGSAGRVVIWDGVEVTIGAPAAGGSPDRASLDRELKAVAANIDRLEQQLANDAFVARAKPEVVQKARDQLDAAREKRAALEEAISRAE
ncbi:MAG: valine--tRNA ligase [Candidatus Dormibacteria bacterium]